MIRFEITLTRSGTLGCSSSPSAVKVVVLPEEMLLKSSAEAELHFSKVQFPGRKG